VHQLHHCAARNSQRAVASFEQPFDRIGQLHRRPARESEPRYSPRRAWRTVQWAIPDHGGHTHVRRQRLQHLVSNAQRSLVRIDSPAESRTSSETSGRVFGMREPCTKSSYSGGISLCNLSVLCVSVVLVYSEFIND